MATPTNKYGRALLLSSRVSCHCARQPYARLWLWAVQLCKNRTVPVPRTRNAAVMVASGRPVAIRLRTKAPHVHFGQRRRHAPKPAGRSPVVAWLPSLSPATGPPSPVAVHEQRAASQPASHAHAWASVIGDVDVAACGRVSGQYRRERNPRGPRHRKERKRSCGDVNAGSWCGAGTSIGRVVS